MVLLSETIKAWWNSSQFSLIYALGMKWHMLFWIILLKWFILQIEHVRTWTLKWFAWLVSLNKRFLDITLLPWVEWHVWTSTTFIIQIFREGITVLPKFACFHGPERYIAVSSFFVIRSIKLSIVIKCNFIEVFWNWEVRLAQIWSLCQFE